MNTSLVVLLLFAVNAVLCGVSDFVNPFIGSGGEGYGFVSILVYLITTIRIIVRYIFIGAHQCIDAT